MHQWTLWLVNFHYAWCALVLQVCLSMRGVLISTCQLNVWWTYSSISKFHAPAVAVTHNSTNARVIQSACSWMMHCFLSWVQISRTYGSQANYRSVFDIIRSMIIIAVVGSESAENAPEVDTINRLNQTSVGVSELILPSAFLVRGESRQSWIRRTLFLQFPITSNRHYPKGFSLKLLQVIDAHLKSVTTERCY
jgi:hypothetical protein